VTLQSLLESDYKDSSGNYYAALVNVDREKSRKMSINFADLSSYQQVEVQKLVGDSFTSENTLDNPTNVM